MHFRKLLSLALPVLAGVLSLHAAETRVIRTGGTFGGSPDVIYDDASPAIFAQQVLLQLNGRLDTIYTGTILSPAEASQLFPAQTDIVMKAEAYLYAHYVSPLQADALAIWTHGHDPGFSLPVLSGPGASELTAARVLAGDYRIVDSSVMSEALILAVVQEALANSSTVDLNEFSFLTADIPATAACDGCVIFPAHTDLWIMYKADTPPTAASLAAAPEPTTIALVTLPILAFGLYRKRKMASLTGDQKA